MLAKLLGSTYHIITFGCQMNKSDSERVAGMLDALGALPASSQDEADIIIFMTCCVREAADERLYGQVASLKNSGALIVVGGCIGQRDAAGLAKKMPHVGVVFGTHNIMSLPALLEEALASDAPVVEVISNTDALETEHPHADFETPVKREHSWHAWLPIMTGCNNFCSYCVVPYVRGRERSQSFEDLVAEAKRLVSDGVREITLLGQNVNSYSGGNMDFSDLLSMFEDVVGLERIRFMTSHPKDFSEKLAALYGTSKKLCPAIHLPVQSGSSRILNLMNRKYDREKYMNHIMRVREICPDIVVTTDFIVGFPGETDEDFEDTMDLIERVRFDSAFTFIFSPRQGTPAAEYENQIPEEIKHERFNRMVERLNAITLEKNKLYIGRTENVLVEGYSKTGKGMLSGRTSGGKLINFKPGEDNPDLLIGQIVDVLIKDVNTFSFIGEITKI